MTESPFKRQRVEQLADSKEQRNQAQSSTSSSSPAAAAGDHKGVQFKKEAEQEFALGVKYERGDGVPRDFKKAYQHFQRAMELGSADAKVKVGMFLMCGLNVVQINEQRALKLLTEAMESKAKGAAYMLGDWFWNHDQRDRAEQLWKMDTSDPFCKIVLLPARAAAPALALPCITQLQALADRGDPHALHLLAWCHELGKGVAVDHKERVRRLKQAAELGHVRAQNLLGNVRDKEKLKYAAFALYRKAAEQGDVPAAWNVAMCYVGEYGVEWEVTEYVRWLRIAANGGIPEAQYLLGTHLASGEYQLAVDKQKAKEWLQKAKNQGFSKAATELKKLTR